MLESIQNSFNKLYQESENPYDSHHRVSEIERLNLSQAFVMKYAKPHFKLLDVGCGNGLITHQIAPLFSETEGWDISEQAIKIALKSNGISTLNFHVGGITEVEKDNWDMILAFEMLYYLTEAERTVFIENIYQKLSIKGIFITSFLIGQAYLPYESISRLFSNFTIVERHDTHRRLFRKIELILFKMHKHIFNKSSSFEKLVKHVGANKKLMRCFDKVTKLLMGKSGITRMYIVAQKNGA